MLSKQLLTSLSLLVIFGAVHAQEDEEKSCIDATPVADFEQSEFHGHFLLTASDDKALEEIECQRYLILDPEEDGTTRVVKMYRNMSDDSTHMEFRNVKIFWDGNGITTNKHSMAIIATDYKNYFVAIACDESTNTDIASLLMAFGNTELEGSEDAQKALDPYNINIYASLTFINQDGCPTDWSDADKNEIDFTYDDVAEDLIAHGITKATEMENGPDEIENGPDDNWSKYKLKIYGLEFTVN